MADKYKRAFKMKFIISSVLFVLCTICSVQSAYHHRIGMQNYYISTPDQANWYQAMRFCAYNGMYLIDVRTHYENLHILSIIQLTKDKYNLTYADFWTSGTDLGSDKQFYWAIIGHQILWEFWAYDEPSNGPAENCLHYYHGKSSKWNDIACETKMYFICRDTLDVPIYKNTVCSTFNLDNI